MADVPSSADAALSTDATSSTDATPSVDVAVPECPFCGSADVERELSFGSALSKRQYCCQDCTTVFEGIRWVERRPGAADDTQ